MAVFRVQTPVTVLEAEDRRHAVAVVQGHDQAANHVVQTGAEAAAGHDARFELARIEIDQFAGAGLLHRRRHVASLNGGADPLQVGLHQHARVIRREIDQRVARFVTKVQRRLDAGSSQAVDAEILIHGRGLLVWRPQHVDGICLRGS